MHGPLFRQEVLDARRTQWLGSVRLTTTRLAWPATIVAIAILAGLALLLAFGHYTRKERVHGRLVPAGGLPVVAAPADGVVTRIALAEGTPADRDQTVLDISGDAAIAASNATLGGVVGTSLARQQGQLRSDLADLDRKRGRQLQQARTAVDSLAQQLQAARRRADLQGQQAKMATDLLQRVAPLAKQHVISAVQLQGYQSAALQAQAAAQANRQEVLDLQRQLEDARSQVATLPLDFDAQHGAVERQLGDLAQQAARNTLSTAQAVRAPRAGIVSGLAVDAGESVRAGQRLFSIIPAHSPLRAELWAPSRAAGALRVGTRVAMRYDAFPYQQYGQRFGRIVAVAASALSPDEIRARAGIDVDAPAYRVLVEPDPGPETRLPLRAAMTLDADLLLERRSLWSLLIAPGPSRDGAGK